MYRDFIFRHVERKYFLGVNSICQLCIKVCQCKKLAHIDQNNRKYVCVAAAATLILWANIITNFTFS